MKSNFPLQKKFKNLSKSSLKVLGSPLFMSGLIHEVSNGGSLLDYATKNNVSYSECIEYIYGSPDRKEAYEGMLKSRGEWYVQRITQELKAIGLLDIIDIYNNDGTVKRIEDIPENARRVIADIEVREIFEDTPQGKKWIGYTKKIKFNNKLKAIELLMKHLKMFVDELRVSGTVEVKPSVSDFDLEQRIQMIRDRKKTVEVKAEPVEEAQIEDV